MGEVIDFPSRASVTKRPPVINTDLELLFEVNESVPVIHTGTYVQIEGMVCVVIWTCGPKLCVLDLDCQGIREIDWSQSVKILTPRDVRESVRGLRAVTRDRDTHSGIVQEEKRRVDGSIAEVHLDHGESVWEWYPFSAITIIGRK